MGLLLVGLCRCDWSWLQQHLLPNERLVALRWRGKVDFFFLQCLHSQLNPLFSLFTNFPPNIFHILSVFLFLAAFHFLYFSSFLCLFLSLSAALIFCDHQFPISTSIMYCWHYLLFCGMWPLLNSSRDVIWTITSLTRIKPSCCEMQMHLDHMAMRCCSFLLFTQY